MGWISTLLCVKSSTQSRRKNICVLIKIEISVGVWNRSLKFMLLTHSYAKYTAFVYQISNNVYYIPFFLSKGPNTACSKVYFCRFLEMPVGTLCVGMFIYIVAHEWSIHALGYIGIHARRAILMHFHALQKQKNGKPSIHTNAQSLPLSGDKVKMKYSSSNQIPSRMDVTS